MAARVPPRVALSVLPLLAALLALPAAHAADSQVCASLPFNTLSFDCDTVCGDGESSCLLYPTAADSPCDRATGSELSACYEPLDGGQCRAQCFGDAHDPSVYRFYVGLQNTIAGMAENEAAVDMKALTHVPFESVQYVRSIGPIQLPAAVTKVVIAGGLEPAAVERGHAGNVTFSSDTFTSVKTVKSITLMNLDLRKWIDNLIESFPPRLQGLDLANTFMRSVPEAIGSFQWLERLYLSRNYVVDWPSSLQFPRLRELHLNQNDLTSFDAVFPSLVYLDLRNNHLESFPLVVVEMPKLRVLRLDNNPKMVPIVFTTSQFAVLSKLAAIHIDASALDASSCEADEIKQLPGPAHHKVCVVEDGGDDESPPVITSASPSTAKPPATTVPSTTQPATSTPSPSTTKPATTATTPSSTRPPVTTTTQPTTAMPSPTTETPDMTVAPTPASSNSNSNNNSDSSPQSAPTAGHTNSLENQQGVSLSSSPSILQIVITSIVALVILCVILFWLLVRRRRKQSINRQEPAAATDREVEKAT